LKTETDVLRHVHVTEGCVVLEAESDVAVARVDVGDVVTLDDDASFVGNFESGDQFEQRRLP
jgi:hypothetical protein